MSAKKRAELAKRKKLRKHLTRDDQRGTRCQANLSVCTKVATDMHEILRRSQGGSATDPDNILLVCRECHRWITDNPDEAIELGLAKSSEPLLHAIRIGKVTTVEQVEAFDG